MESTNKHKNSKSNVNIHYESSERSVEDYLNDDKLEDELRYLHRAKKWFTEKVSKPLAEKIWRKRNG